MAPGQRLAPVRRPSSFDGSAPNDRPRRLVRERWTPIGSAPPANPDKARWAPPVAAVVQEIAFDTPVPPQLERERVDPDPAPRGYQEAQRRRASRRPTQRRKPFRTTQPVNGMPRVRVCSSSSTSVRPCPAALYLI